MDRRNILKALAGLAICPVCTTTGFAAEGVHWRYEGDAGPAKWGDLPMNARPAQKDNRRYVLRSS